LEDQPEPGPYLAGDQSLRRNEVRIRTAIRSLIRLLIRDAAQATAGAVEEIGAESVADIRRHAEPVARFSPEVQASVEKLKDFLLERVYLDPSWKGFTSTPRFSG